MELNLKKNDLVNFNMAKKAGAAVLLVADIDRGGVFAATIGAFHLLTPGERRMLKGFIINKFRGDPALFEEGVAIIEKRTKRPVLGVVPYAGDLVLPEEDSVALARKRRPAAGKQAGGLKIGVVRLPHISNYTDFDPLEQEPGVNLRYLDHRDELDGLDLLILPGTKNTISDLLYLKETGLFRRIQAYVREGGRLVGICGGYQILGQEVRDPLGVEGDPRTEAGLNLLPVVTTMAGAKTTTQVEARVAGAERLRGAVGLRDPHGGHRTPGGGAAGLRDYQPERPSPSRWPMAGSAPDRRVWGTYLHGLFDNDGFRRVFLKNCGGPVRARKLRSGDVFMKTFKKPNWIAWRTCCGATWTWPRSMR